MSMTRRDGYWWKKRAQFLLTKWSGGRVMGFEKLNHGISDVTDVAQRCPQPSLILDVGANEGQSAIKFRSAFPSARIISFEPVEETFDLLCRRTASLGVECQRLAVGSRPGRATIHLTNSSFTSSLKEPEAGELVATSEVEVTTVDDFVASNRIDTIDLLKIDVEGFDLEVIAGGARTLAEGKVRFALVEVGFAHGDARHPLFDDVRDALAQHQFDVYGIYDQTLEWSGEPRLRFANALFYCQT